MNYKSYKGRTIDKTKKVMIYKNLHNGLFSVKQNGLVVAHVESFCMDSVSFKVSEAGRQRVLKEKKKNVHAYIIGKIFDINKLNVKTDFFASLVANQSIRYNPYKSNCFYRQYEDSQSGIPNNKEIPNMYLIAHHEQGIAFRIIEDL